MIKIKAHAFNTKQAKIYTAAAATHETDTKTTMASLHH
jgi:hypothetical protein